MDTIDEIINKIKNAKQEHEIKKGSIAEAFGILKKEIDTNTSASQIKKFYESNTNTNAFTDNDKAKLSNLENYDDTTIQNSVKTKVDKITGKGLSTNDFTTQEKEKLAKLELSAFKGEFTSEVELNTILGETGSFAFVNTGEENVIMFIWDSVNLKWIKQLGESDIETPESIKAKYESNDNTNVFTDDEKQKLLSLTNYDDSEIKYISSANKENITLLQDNVHSIRQQITDESHFRGYFLTKVELDSLNNAAVNDFAYLVEVVSPSTTSNKWIYSDTGTEEEPVYEWVDSGILVPDQMVPKSTSTPLMDGTAAIGVENAYAAGDHIHPTDTTRVSKEEFESFENRIDNQLNSYTISALKTYNITADVNIWDYIQQIVISSDKNYVVNVMCLNRTDSAYNITFPATENNLTHIKDNNSISLKPNTCKEISCAYDASEKIVYWEIGKEKNINF